MEKEFDKYKFKLLLKLTQGKRSLNKFGLDSNVDPGYLSRFMNFKIDSAPSPNVLKRLADVAHNNVTYEELMEVAGYIEESKGGKHMGKLQNILINKRMELKLSLREAAKLMGISHSYLDKLEKGFDPRTGLQINLTPHTLMLISKAYGVKYERLMKVVGYIGPGIGGEEVDLRKVLEEQIEILTKENETIIEPEQVRRNIETIIELVKTIASYLTNQGFDEHLE